MTTVVVLPNGTAVHDAPLRIERYFSEMNRGRKYEEWVHGDENRTTPNQLTTENWNAAFLIFAKGMPWKSVSGFFGSDAANPLPLNQIPHDADLMADWPRIRAATGAVLGPLLACRGVRAANATKLLYQKRPCLIPILDSFVCGILRVGLPDKAAESVLRAIDAYRQAMLEGQNGESLAAVRRWVRTAESLHVTAHVRRRLSELRIFDILCWGEGSRMTVLNGH